MDKTSNLHLPLRPPWAVYDILIKSNSVYSLLAGLIKMMKNKDKLINFLSSNNPFRNFYEEGSTTDEIKNRIVDTLQPFFNSRRNLEENAINLLVPDYINLTRLRRQYSGIDGDIKLLLSTYSDAKSVDSALLYETISELMPEIIETGNKFWTFVHLERDKSELEFYEFVKESFENIGDIIEGIMKAQIIENVAVNRITRRKTFDIAKIKSTKFGVLLDELIQHSNYPHLFKTQPDEIKFSDWRNISAHKSYQIRTDLVLCHYGVAPKKIPFHYQGGIFLIKLNKL